MDSDNQPSDDTQPIEKSYQEVSVPPQDISPQENTPTALDSPPRSKTLVYFLRFVIIGGGLFIVFVIGLGISFSACFTIKGPPPPECGPVSFVTLVLMPGASLLFLIPWAKKIK